MKSFIVAACIVACVYAAGSEKEAQVLSNEYDLTPEGNYRSAYETENGISGQSSSVLKAVGKDEVAQEVSGSYSYTAPDGQLISVNYVANENGYEARGAHLPTPPPAEPIPDYILRSIEYNLAHPYSEKN
ncbi:hypothetical protein PYW07_004706 [Mythimna separata]|uniref:Uncharacterized protein n=1 Tax=Mythimna separata TaxID=271217 RepID=A0AAD7YYT4_MYTSE|nr:hypothetical protein PYW07_004706 [Mythimna separata]